MASKVEAALGTQRQFSGTPEGTYEKRLTSLPIAPTRPAESQLARAFGLLGNTLQAEGQADLERQQKIGIAEAEKVAAGMTDEDYHKRTSVQILSQFGDADTSDNPYAIALIEKMRGKYFNAKFNQEYDLFAKEDGGFKKTSVEEITRYEEFMRKKYQEVVPVTINQEAFNSGYFDNFMVQKVQKAHDQIAWRSKEMDNQRVSGISAALSEITANYQTFTPEQKTQIFNNQMAQLGMSGGYASEAIEQTNQMLQDYATRTGDYEWIEDLKKNGILGVNLEGKQMRVSDFINTNDFVRIAEMTRTHKWTQLEQDTFTKLSKMTLPELNYWFATAEKTNNHLYQTMVNFRDSLIQKRANLEERQNIHDTNTTMKSGVQKAAFDLVNRHMSLWINGANTDVNGRPTASSLSDFEPLHYQKLDASGNMQDEEYKVTQQDVNTAIVNQIQWINKQDWTSEQKADATLELLEWGVAKDYANALKNNVRSELSTLTNDGLKRNSNGAPSLSGTVSSVLTMLRTNHGRTNTVLGDANTRELETLELLTQGVNDLEKGVSLYAQARANRQDPQMRQNVEGLIGTKLNFGSARSFEQFEAIDGQKVDADYTLATNADFLRRVRTVAENLMYSNKYTKDEAVDTALNYARQNTYVYRDTIIPRTLFSGFNVEDKNTLGRKVLDDCVSIYANDKAVAPNVVNVDYDIDSKMFRVWSGNLEPYEWSAQQLTDYGNKKAYEDTITGQAMQRNITIDEANAARSELNNAPNNALQIAGWNPYPSYYDQNRGDRP